eukprot:2353504-Lingulodinium_polyedra.AAC.1
MPFARGKLVCRGGEGCRGGEQLVWFVVPGPRWRRRGRVLSGGVAIVIMARPRGRVLPTSVARRSAVCDARAFSQRAARGGVGGRRVSA